VEDSDATITELPLGAPGRVPWWAEHEVALLDIMVHILNDTTRHAGHAGHAGHADILREGLDGRTGIAAQWERRIDTAAREARLAKIDQAARAADPVSM
jgi:hypothetical protein